MTALKETCQISAYLILMRGVNVGGKNKLPMAEFKQFLVRQGFFKCHDIYCQRQRDFNV
jgi:hypothetical protein